MERVVEEKGTDYGVGNGEETGMMREGLVWD